MTCVPAAWGIVCTHGHLEGGGESVETVADLRGADVQVGLLQALFHVRVRHGKVVARFPPGLPELLNITQLEVN